MRRALFARIRAPQRVAHKPEGGKEVVVVEGGGGDDAGEGGGGEGGIAKLERGERG
jgi:hypothetical protein